MPLSAFFADTATAVILVVPGSTKVRGTVLTDRGADGLFERSDHGAHVFCSGVRGAGEVVDQGGLA